MENIIESITEAFSMQPAKFSIIESSDRYFYKESDCKEILLENLSIGKICGDNIQELYYVGYNFEGKKLFQYIAKSVNVNFKQ